MAGEKQSLLACIMNDKDRAAGRSGVGAVMGSKKLKAIVVRPTNRNADETLASAEALKEANKDVMVNIKENGLTSSGLRELGTPTISKQKIHKITKREKSTHTFHFYIIKSRTHFSITVKAHKCHNHLY